ncbi:MAG: O-antigen ligase family protein [Pseudomonadota bacterium]
MPSHKKAPHKPINSIHFYSFVYYIPIILGLNFPNHEKPIPSFFIEFISGLGILGLALNSITKKAYRPDFCWHIFLLIPILGWIQYLAGIIRLSGDAVIVTGYGLYAWCIAMLVSSMTPDNRYTFIEHLFKALVLSWLLGFTLQLMQWWGIRSMWIASMGTSRPAGNLTQPNHFATWTLLTAWAALWLQEKKAWPRLGVASLLVCFAFSLALAASRTGFLAIAICTMWAWWQDFRFPKQSETNNAVSKALYITTLLTLTAVATYLRPAIEWIAFGSHHSPEMLRSYDGERLRLLNFALQATLERPWTGWGIYQTPLAQTKSAGGSGLYTQLYPSTHNLLADIFLWLGIPLGLFISFLIGIALIRALQPNTKKPNHLPLHCILITLMLHAMLEYPLYYLMWLGIFGAVLAATSDTNTPKRSNISSNLNKTLNITLQATIFVFWACIISSYLLLQERRSVYYLAGECTFSSPISKAVWQRHELMLDALCNQPIPAGIDKLDVAILAGSSEVLHKLYRDQTLDASQREAVLQAGCRIGAFHYFCLDDDRRTRN